MISLARVLLLFIAVLSWFELALRAPTPDAQSRAVEIIPQSMVWGHVLEDLRYSKEYL